jgi:hypothetical protein
MGPVKLRAGAGARRAPLPVRAVYLHPADQPRVAAYERAARRCIDEVREWYAGRAGVTFGPLPLEVIRARASYREMRRGGDLRRYSDEADHSQAIGWIESIRDAVGAWRPDTVTLVFAQGGGGVALSGSAAGGARYAIVGDWVLEPISGVANPLGVPCAQCPPQASWAISGGTPTGTVAHELGHAFGLSHPAPVAGGGSIMFAHWEYPHTGFLPHERTALWRSPFLAPPAGGGPDGLPGALTAPPPAPEELSRGAADAVYLPADLARLPLRPGTGWRPDGGAIVLEDAPEAVNPSGSRTDAGGGTPALFVPWLRALEFDLWVELEARADAIVGAFLPQTERVDVVSDYVGFVGGYGNTSARLRLFGTEVDQCPRSLTPGRHRLQLTRRAGAVHLLYDGEAVCWSPDPLADAAVGRLAVLGWPGARTRVYEIRVRSA